MGTNIYGRFSDQNPDVAQQQIRSAANNQIVLNTAILEQDFLRSTPVIFQQSGLTANVANPVPSVTQAGQAVIGAALSGIDQPPDPGPGGGGYIPPACFIGTTLVRFMGDVQVAFTELYANARDYLGRPILSFDDDGNVAEDILDGVHIHFANAYEEVYFEGDDTPTGVMPEHPYLTANGKFVPMGELNASDVVWDYEGACAIVSKQTVWMPEGIAVFNLTTRKYHHYWANNKKVHNTKAKPEDRGF